MSQQETTMITLEDLIQEIKDALEYGKILGYTECLNQTMGHKPESSNPEHAMIHYVKNIKESYEKK